MKKLLSTTIILAMIATMMMAMCVSVSATDAVADYTIYYKGDGKFYSDPGYTQEITLQGLSADGNVITMENFHFATEHYGCIDIKECEATIVLKGENSLSSEYTGVSGSRVETPAVIQSNKLNLTIKGDGSLKIVNKSVATSYMDPSIYLYGGAFSCSWLGGHILIVKVEGNPTLEFSTVGTFLKSSDFDISSVSGMSAIASTDPEGSNPVAYNAADVGTYKYFKLYKSETHGANTADSSNIAMFIFMGMLSIVGAGLVLKKTQA